MIGLSGGAIVFVGVFFMASFTSPSTMNAYTNKGPSASPAVIPIGIHGSLTEISCDIHWHNYTYQDVKQIVVAYYNAKADMIIYVLRTCVDAVNGGNIASGSSYRTITNIIKNEGYYTVSCVCSTRALREKT